jgi:hypothetical protein
VSHSRKKEEKAKEDQEKRIQEKKVHYLLIIYSSLFRPGQCTLINMKNVNVPEQAKMAIMQSLPMGRCAKNNYAQLYSSLYNSKDKLTLFT